MIYILVCLLGVSLPKLEKTYTFTASYTLRGIRQTFYPCNWIKPKREKIKWVTSISAVRNMQGDIVDLYIKGWQEEEKIEHFYTPKKRQEALSMFFGTVGETNYVDFFIGPRWCPIPVTRMFDDRWKPDKSFRNDKTSWYVKEGLFIMVFEKD